MTLLTPRSRRSRTCVVICLVLLSWREGSKVEGHGRLIDPPSRATMWRYGFDTKADYDDNAGYCGGKSQLWNRFGGRCGVCGDPWEPIPRAHERGGRYYDGTPVRYYEEGDVINVVMGITANHRGWVEFRLCPYDRPADNDAEYDDGGRFVEVSQACLDKHLLQLADGSGTRFYLPEPYRVGEYSVDVLLPPGLSCNKCLLQWKWNVANSWGTDSDGTSCVGCGQQEQFYACADIVIESTAWYDDDYPPFSSETEPPSPSPSVPDFYPPALPPEFPTGFPPEFPTGFPPEFPTGFQPEFPTGFPATDHPWYVPDDNGKGSNPGVSPGDRGGNTTPENDEGNRDFKPAARSPGTVDPRGSSMTPGTPSPPVTEKPHTTSTLPSPRVHRPRPTPTSTERPRKDENEDETPDTTTTATTVATVSRKTPTGSGSGWNQTVPSFWKWLLLHNHRAKELPPPKRPVTVGASPTLKNVMGRRKNSTATASWWQKLLSLTAWEPRKSADLLLLKPRSRSKKSTTTARLPTTTANATTPLTPETPSTGRTTAIRQRIADKGNRVPKKVTPSRSATPSEATNGDAATPGNTAVKETPTPVASKNGLPTRTTTTSARMSAKKIMAEKEELDVSRNDPSLKGARKDTSEPVLPWWLHKTGPSFFFHSWVPGGSWEENSSPNPRYRDISRDQSLETWLSGARIYANRLPGIQLSKVRSLDVKFADVQISRPRLTDSEAVDVQFTDIQVSRPRLTDSEAVDVQSTEAQNSDSRFPIPINSENRVFKDLQDDTLELDGVVPVPYQAVIDPFLLQKRKSRTSMQLTADSSDDNGHNEDSDSYDAPPPSRHDTVNSAAAASPTNQDGKEQTRDISLSNKHGFETVNLGVPFEAADWNTFISPAEVSEDGMTKSVVPDLTKTEQRDEGTLSAQQLNTQLSGNPVLPNENVPLPDDTFLQDGSMIAQPKGFLLPDGYDYAGIGYLSLQSDARFLAQEVLCTPVGVWARYIEMWKWCQLHCRGGYCPTSHCVCS